MWPIQEVGGGERRERQKSEELPGWPNLSTFRSAEGEKERVRRVTPWGLGEEGGQVFGIFYPR